MDDLLSQMTLEEKAGLMFHTMVGMGKDGSLIEKPSPFNPIATSELIAQRRLNHFNLYEIAPPRETAIWHNRLQKLAERTRTRYPRDNFVGPTTRFQQQSRGWIADRITLTVA